MSIMAVKHILTPACKAAVTASFNGLSLLFIKYLPYTIAVAGRYYESNFSLFFMPVHYRANIIIITLIIFAVISADLCSASYQRGGSNIFLNCSSRLYLGGIYE